MLKGLKGAFGRIVSVLYEMLSECLRGFCVFYGVSCLFLRGVPVYGRNVIL
jgi:hypothetical protein